MKIQKRFIRKYKDKEYYKYVLNIPSDVLKESGIEYGEDVDIESRDGEIVLKKKD